VTSPPHHATPAELKARIEAERAGCAFVSLRDGQRRQQIVALPPEGTALVGRDPDCTIRVDWDACVSRVHAELSRVGGHWVVGDDGLSRNGTLVNGEPVVGRRRLRDLDQIVVGDTTIEFREPSESRLVSTALPQRAAQVRITPAQRRVIVALCRPCVDGPSFAVPATNQAIATELHLSVAVVKTHLRALFGAFGVAGLAQNEKRAALVQRALESGTVSARDLRG
jgi:pSer/pThr/pTyr-binding forkhead associated (FHA) protein